MLILAKITTSSAGGYADYLDGKAQPSQLGDYYLKDGERTEAPGRWAAGAQQFGLDPDQPVTAEQLHSLMEVRRPDSGEELRRVGGSGEAVAAIDATFSAPKSVSAAWALADPTLREGIERAHETAVDRALTYATRQVLMLRRRVSQDDVIHEKATGLIATSWRHTTARAVDQQVPDPQLHSHVLLHGAVRRDGRVVAIDSRAWLVHQREVGAAYRTELARELRALGLAIRRGTGRGGRYFEIDAIPQPLVDRWSSRHHQVQAAIRQRLTDQEHELEMTIAAGGEGAVDAAEQLELLRRTGQLSPAQERLMGTITRSAKAPITTTDLDTEWRHTGLRHGISRERIDVLRRQPCVDLEPAGRWELLDGLTEFDATFPARDARAVALEQSAGAPIDAALSQLRALRSSDDILVLVDGTGTTRRHRGRERAVVAVAQRLADATVEPIPVALTERETERLDRELGRQNGRLSDEQRAAIRLACGTRPLVVIEGQAGTGKSTTLAGIARAHQACGREIVVTSTAALAAERLASELNVHGVACSAYSTAALHAALAQERIALTAQTTVIHDEAALASTREQLDLLNDVEQSGARLIAVGDPEQNQPVGAGGLWSPIEQAVRGNDAQVELTVNQRARQADDRREQARFRGGRLELAVRGYAARDLIHLHHELRRAEDQALNAAHGDRTRGISTIVVAQTSNEHLDALNARAQAIRQQDGQLGDKSLSVPGRPYELRAGDHIQIRRTIRHPDHGALRNGTAAEITLVNRDSQTAELRLADGSEVTLNREQIDSADLRLAYVQHPFPAQGHTTDTTHLIVTEQTTRHGAYVGLSRARDSTHIYAAPTPDAEVDRLSQLAENMSRSEPEVPSIHIPLEHEAALVRAVERRERLGGVAAPSASAAERVAEEAHETDREPARDRRIDQGRQASRADQPKRGEPEPRRWPGTRGPEANAREMDPALRADVERERDLSPGFEP